MTEAQFQRWVIAAARALGWKLWHVPAPMRNVGGKWVGAKEAAGLSDLIMIHLNLRLLYFVELKDEKGKPSAAQTEFLESVTALGLYPTVRSFLWRPGMEDEIELALKGVLL